MVNAGSTEENMYLIEFTSIHKWAGLELYAIEHLRKNAKMFDIVINNGEFEEDNKGKVIELYRSMQTSRGTMWYGLEIKNKKTGEKVKI